jgi:metal iron transporter
MIAVGILGATIMPHALFLGSFMSTQDRIGNSQPSLPNPVQAPDVPPTPDIKARFKKWLASLFEVTRAERVAVSRDYRMKYARENSELSFIQAHLKHGIVDIVTSLLGVAVPINAAFVTPHLSPDGDTCYTD